MKKIEAIFPEEQLDTVKKELDAAGFVGMTLYYVKGRGHQGGILLEWRAGTYQVDFLPKVLLMIVVEDHQCQEVINIIQQAVGQDLPPEEIELGVGRIIVTQIEQMINVVSPQS